MAPQRRSRTSPLLVAGLVCSLCCASWTFAAPQTVPRSVQQGSATGLTASPVRSWALGTLPRDESVVSTNAVAAGANFFSKVFAAGAQGATAAFVAAILSAICEPLVNRLLVKRMTVGQAMKEMNMKLITNFFLTTFPTNMLKFPVFEIINMAMTFTAFSPGVSGFISGFLFCTVMLPVTNYRFRKSMGWEIGGFGNLYQAYVPTVVRDIIYGFARGFVNPLAIMFFKPQTFTQNAFVFAFVIWAACILSSPCNEWRGYTLQPKDKKLTFSEYFKPVNYARSTGIGATIMGISLFIGRLVTPYAEKAFAFIKLHPAAGVVALGAFVALFKAISTEDDTPAPAPAKEEKKEAATEEEK